MMIMMKGFVKFNALVVRSITSNKLYCCRRYELEIQEIKNYEFEEGLKWWDEQSSKIKILKINIVTNAIS